MLKSSDIKIGTRLKCCVYNSVITFGTIGTISAVNKGGGWSVTDDSGNLIGKEFYWCSYDTWEVAPLRTRPMVQDDIQVGTKVVCAFDEWTGQIGTICKVSGKEFLVRRPNGTYVGQNGDVNYWMYLTSFDVILNDLDPWPKPPAAPAVVEIKPCPKKYYGIDPCTCGKCAKPKTNPFFVKV